MQVNQWSQELKGEETMLDNPLWFPCGFNVVLQFWLHSDTSDAFMHLGSTFLERWHVFQPLAQTGRKVPAHPRNTIPRCSTFGFLSTASSFKLSYASLASLNIYRRQQCFWLWLIGSYAFAVSVRVFVFVPARLAEQAPTLVENEPFPHSHRKQFL